MQLWWALFQKQTKNTNPNLKRFTSRTDCWTNILSTCFVYCPIPFKWSAMMTIASSSNTEQNSMFTLPGKKMLLNYINFSMLEDQCLHKLLNLRDISCWWRALCLSHFKLSPSFWHSRIFSAHQCHPILE